MKPILQILLKVWVQQYYQRNAGFFLFLFVVLFGVVQNPIAYHFKLMQGIVTSYITLLIVVIIWILYACKCGALVFESIAKEKVWLYELQALSKKKLLLSLCIAQAMLFLPATIYIVLTIGVGIYIKQYLTVIMLVLFLILIHILFVALYYQSFFDNSTQVQLFNNSLLLYRFPKHFYSFLLWYNFYKGKLKTVAVKFFSLLLLFIPLVWNSDHFELSDFVIFFQMSIAAHAIIVYDSVQYLEKDFRVLRNVPIPLYKMLLIFIITYTVLLLPEMFFLSYFGTKVHLSVSIFSLLLYYIGQLLLFTGLAYERHQKIDSYLLYIGLITVLSLMLTPLKSFGLIGVALVIIAFSLFSGSYYKYEPGYEEDRVLTDDTDRHR